MTGPTFGDRGRASNRPGVKEVCAAVMRLIAASLSSSGLPDAVVVLRQKTNFLNRIKLICPVQSLPPKINRLRRRANQKYNGRRLIPSRGDVGHRHERWGEMRWTRQRRVRKGDRRAVLRERSSRTRRRRLSPVEPFDAPKSDFGRRRQAKTGRCVRQKRVVLAPVAGVKSAEVLRAQPGSAESLIRR